MESEIQTSKSSLRNNIIIAFFLVIMIWGISVMVIFQNLLQNILIKEGLSEEVIRSINREFIAVSTGVTSVGFVVVLWIGWLFSKTITKPIRELSESVNEIANGNLDRKVDIKSEDELGYLAASFNEMAQKLKKSRDSLEWKVQERTQKLSETNEQLQVLIERSEVLAKEALVASEAKGNFLANMSHEIRTPMNSILGFGRILAEEDLDAEHQKYINLIVKSSEELLILINDILDFSKIEAGKLNVEMLDVNIREVVYSIESTMNPLALDKGVKLKIINDGLVHHCMNTDPIRLKQCLINVIGNAIKFSENGQVCLKASSIEKDGQSFIQFDVEDNGIGIAEDKIDDIFKAFTQADDSTTRKFGGTGLGLAITRRIIEQLGGEISVRSKVGHGTTFTIQIPVGQASVSLLQSTDDGRVEIAPIKNYDANIKFEGSVLIAEDVKTNQMLIRVMVERLGLKVKIVENGQEAVDEALAECYDIIFMDMQMPVMNGYNATRTLRGKGMMSPIVALTANAMMGDDEKCLEAGCDGYLSKPVEKQKLIEVLKNNLPAYSGV